jgi:hypothetical protein
MGLLIIISTGFALGVINGITGPAGYAIKPYLGFLMYGIFVGALVYIRITIRTEFLRGKERARARSLQVHPSTGSIDLPVATDKETIHD